MALVRISAFSLGICGECGEPLVVPDEINFKAVIGKMKCPCGTVINADSLGVKRFGDGYKKVRWVHPVSDAHHPVWRGEEPYAGFRLRSWWVVPRFVKRNGKPIFPEHIVVVCQKWLFELGGVAYPGGFSIHRTMRDRDAYAADYTSKHNSPCADMFRTDGEPYFCIVSMEMFRKIESRNHGYHSDRSDEACPAPALGDTREGELVYRISA